MVITFEELRHIKDALPHGSMERIAEELNINIDTVRNYFGAEHFESPEKIADVHFEKGASGGVVQLEHRHSGSSQAYPAGTGCPLTSLFFILEPGLVFLPDRAFSFPSACLT